MVGNMKKILFHTVIMALVAIVLSCTKSENNSSSGNPGAVSQTGARAQSGPTFAAADLNGGTRTFEEFKGKGPLVLNFWGTWCPPCRMELPDLKKIYADYKPQGLEIVSLAVKDNPGRVKDFVQQNGIGWVMLMSNRDAELAFNVTVGIPTTIFINRDGVEVSRLIGMQSYESFKNEINKIL
jgi:thiol-disulfide isomerase/thioredoxin